MGTLHPGIDQQFIGLGIALGLGMLLGLQREWLDKPVGLRSFALISLLGGLSVLLSQPVGSWLTAAGLIAVGLLLAAQVLRANLVGITTLAAALVAYVIGAAAVAGYWIHAIVTGGVVMVLLHWKQPLHHLVERLGKSDIEVITRFVLITLVILPVLPNQTFGPYSVFNPFTTWLMVVLIVGINLVGYIAFRLLGTQRGVWLGGLFGGFISSTATTFSYAGMTKQQPHLGNIAALVILIASTIVYARIAVELFVVAPNLLPLIIWPLFIFVVVLFALSAFVYSKIRHSDQGEIPERDNPARITEALSFALLYAFILFAIAAAKDLIGVDAVYLLALISGLTDVDALTLSVGRLYSEGTLDAILAGKAIFLASLSNLFFKIMVASFLGSASLRHWIIKTGCFALPAGAAILIYWPTF